MNRALLRTNRRVAHLRWNHLDKSAFRALYALTSEHQFSISTGDLIWLEHGWYVTYTGLIRLAQRRRCAGIHSKIVTEFCDSQTQRWAFEATVYKSDTCRGFIGFGDADPSSVSPLVRGAEMRVAETRAVNRALRKAYGIGICSVEEIGSLAALSDSPMESYKRPPVASKNSDANAKYRGAKVRDRLCLLIRQHQLDASLVKCYATDFCGVKTLREATRQQVENFVTHLADCAEKDRNALISQLNSYLREKDGAA